mmetsp:Transcript_21622/g.36832  ORF Transcript_21622/g.36832 Transcript_21622/m.36832 type:complete len:283 (-) Transcript_21622:577-1425(-)|eukprot:CAMPEP_0119107996 /NCGR_PEP_ID=MMETSP1180-20130426/12880_1 /TAXON_ID=3052 ORGANISM="Chlamydomonas cf sp, Strain CCMP681" /NCGR_SAMPLE_ID=MMETSP1180 /ASSEMBLY_ACC=CAM_ASM_000741 /LENGTH=282 /DNA_ID=CAMNT_0007093553 /DNA_START=37 /DNA_END=885 /DNA_ORIENTATION=+
MQSIGPRSSAAQCTQANRVITSAPGLPVISKHSPRQALQSQTRAPSCPLRPVVLMQAQGSAAATQAAQPSQPAHNGAPTVPATKRRIATVTRKTKETQVELTLDLDGTGICIAETPVGFLNHMLDQISSHGLFDLTVKATGDTWIDDHHTTEDIALAFGSALSQALGDRKGINRFGEFTAPLDEALTHVVLDLSGRSHLSCNLVIPAQRIGTFDTELVEHFFQSFSNTSGTTLHIRQLAGQNSHHIVECTFKAFARALRRATEYDDRRAGTIASSKGVLTQQ